MNAKERALAALQKWVRIRDCKRWGVCISCGKPITVGTSDGGHFIARGNAPCPALEVDERNVHAQCRECNRGREGAHAEYRFGLIERYGEDYPRRLELMKEACQGGAAVGLSDADRELATRRFTDADYLEIERICKAEAMKWQQ